MVAGDLWVGAAGLPMRQFWPSPAVASTATSKAYYIYKNTGAHQLIIDGYAGEYIDGAETYTITNHYECIQIVCDGTEWFMISKK